nr:RecName: Full=Unknown protein from 2D-PAGE [Nicotiana tabacum]
LLSTLTDTSIKEAVATDKAP